MRKVLALTRAGFLAAASYRLAFVTQLLAIGAAAVPIYFITGALQGTMAPVVAGEGSSYFGFVIVGLAAATWMQFAMSTVGDTLLGSVRSGTFEAYLATPTRLPTLLAGLAGWPAITVFLRFLVMLAAGALFGVAFRWTAMPAVLLVLGLLAAAYLSVGIVVSALVLAFRTSGPLVSVATITSYLLGGVYYPTRVIPSWIRDLADLVPLAPALRALRRLLLDGASLATVGSDVGHLALLAAAYLGLSIPCLVVALHHARRSGTLTQY
jgi:ABC-2 type transport system permease protein